MSEAARRDFEYLSPPGLSYWRWTDNGRVITWNDSTTIAFREEVEHVLSRLAGGGLPPFGASVLLLAACRPGWRETGRKAIESHARVIDEAGGLKGGFTPAWFPEVLDGLDRVAALRIELRTGTDAKAAIAGLVFDATRMRGSPGEAEEVLRLLAERPSPPAPPMSESLRWDSFRFLQDLAALRDGLPRVTDEAVETRLRTGMDRIPAPAPDVPGIAAEDVRTLLAELRDDPELSGLARLATQLMAAVHLPRRVSDPEEMPLGGASDISNRGPIERLLVSELAHDELTLAARIALREALYLRREQPPRNLPGRRWILLDAGIRMWGVPRVFGAAVALALAATAERGQPVSAWRATSRGVDPVDLGSRSGILEHLEALEAAPVPVAGLARFLEDAAGVAGPVDLVAVTAEETLADPEFGAALAWLGERQLQVATVDAAGRQRLVLASSRGRRLVAEASLSLEDLLAAPRGTRHQPPGVPLLAPEPDASLPVFLAVRPCPFFLPHEVEPVRAASHPEFGTVAATRDGRLMHWAAPDLAARQLTTGLPRGALHWMGVDGEGLAHAVVGSSRVSLHLVTADLRSGNCSVLRLAATGYPPASVFRHGDAVFLCYSRKLDVLDLNAGELLRTIPIEHGAAWGPGRYFRDNAGWGCVSWDGVSGVLERVPVAEPRRGHLAVWDRPGHDGPWTVSAQGQVICLADGAVIEFPGVGADPTLLGISRDGNRVALRLKARNRAVVLDLPARRMLDIGAGFARALHPEVDRLVRYSVRHRFASVGREGGTLALVPSGDAARVVALDGSPPALHFRLAGPGPIGKVSFVSTPGPRDSRFGLKSATWQDGSKAWLDARGLLHLRSSDRTIPELSLVLSEDQPLAGWTSDGALCGPRYFVGDAAPGDPGRVFATLRRFVERLP